MKTPRMKTPMMSLAPFLPRAALVTLLAFAATPAHAAPAHAAQITTLFRFRASPTHERTPEGGLIALDGALYGTARFGGAKGGAGDDGGTVFRIAAVTGAETTLAHFPGGATQGADPQAPLTAVSGLLYGTTAEGYGTARAGTGAYRGAGTVFRLDPATGKTTVLHGFAGADGAQPTSALTFDGGDFYGTTAYGGPKNAGTIYRIDEQGQFTTLYAFGDPATGCQPVGGVVIDGATLYGATKGCGKFQAGAIYGLNLVTGNVAVLHAFAAPDGRPPEPSGALLAANGALYGTTLYGGASGMGAVYRLDLHSLAFTILHSFSGADGKYPPSGVILQDGRLYGVAESGGAASLGAVFAVEPATGATTLIYSFDGTNGDTPISRPVAHGGALYGTTLDQYGDYRGSVYRLVP
jgi:uncharacterized repeat protein (TIGR03803 family)